MTYLRDFFEGRVLVKGYYYHGNNAFPKTISGDLVMLTSQELTAKVRDLISGNAHIIYIERTLSKNQVQRLRSIRQNTRALLVDYAENTAEQMISLMMESGIRNIDFVPIGRNTAPERITALLDQGISMAVTAGLSYLVPWQIKVVIDMDWAPIDAKTLLEISVILDLYNESLETKLFCYMKTLITSEKNIMFFMKSNVDIKNFYKALMELMDHLESSILIADRNGEIVNWNQNALNLLKIKGSETEQRKKINEILPKSLMEIISAPGMIQDKMYYFTELKQNLVINKIPINIVENTDGYMLVFREISGFMQQHARVRRQMQQNFYRAKYTFGDILGNSEKILKCKEVGRRLSDVDATVLITGESGTGKELFAQSIHNASHRKNMPFVAINCAALASSLLESEMFGYERGAFTGSRSEGHVGLFELAHKGTIFLDEIGEIPLNLQVKLLRVLEEKEIRRVGGEINIPIDVRVIAATNQDLQVLCQQKKFRLDLYYRLNILPLRLIPLRERREDILILARHFLQVMKKDDKPMTQRLQQALLNYPWEGNVRELYNCIQYMSYLCDDVLDVDLLPDYMHVEPPPDESEQHAANSLSRNFLPEDRTELLQILYFLERNRAGRKEITAYMRKQRDTFSEYRVRQLLKKLRDDDLISYAKGRGGVRLTALGWEILQTNRKLSQMGVN